MNRDSARPAILIDLKKDRIRIYKKTLHAIGDPKYILLLVNPEERAIVILRSDMDDQRAVRLPQARFNDKQCFELHSKALIQNLRCMSADWVDDYSYRIYGDVVDSEGVAQFCISDALPTYGMRG